MISKDGKNDLKVTWKNDALFTLNQHKILNKKNVGYKSYHEIPTELHMTLQCLRYIIHTRRYGMDSS